MTATFYDLRSRTITIITTPGVPTEIVVKAVGPDDGDNPIDPGRIVLDAPTLRAMAAVLNEAASVETRGK